VQAAWEEVVGSAVTVEKQKEMMGDAELLAPILSGMRVGWD